MIEMAWNELLSALGAVRSEGGAGANGKLPATGVSTDSRTTRPGDLFFAIKGQHRDGHDFVDQAVSRGAVGCVVSDAERVREGIRAAADAHKSRVDDPTYRLILVDDTIAALGRLAARQRELMRAKVVAVTGSNGKTTTKGMIHAVLSTALRGRAAVKSFNNALGVPLTLLAVEPEDEYVVVEIGSNAPGEVEALARMARPDIGVITSVGPAHVEGLGGLAGVVREKASLAGQVRDGGLVAVCADHPELLEQVGEVFSRRSRDLELLTLGRSEWADLRVEDVSGDLAATSFRIGGGPVLCLNVCGAHNANNAAAAYAVGRRMGLTDEQIAAGLAAYQPAEMRLNVLRRGGVTVIDDCYNANPASMRAAIQVLALQPSRRSGAPMAFPGAEKAGSSGRRVLVVGDMLELGTEGTHWHEWIGREAATAGIEVIVAAGHFAECVVTGARAVNPEVDAVACAGAEQAGDEAASRLRPGDVVLVKGSRGMGMERAVRAILETASASAEAAIANVE